MKRPTVVIDARDRDGVRGYHLIAALMLLPRDLGKLDLRLAAPLDREEAHAFEAFCHDTGLDYRAIESSGQTEAGDADLLILAVDALRPLEVHADRIGKARRRVIAGLSRDLAGADSVTIGDPDAHDTRFLAAAIDGAIDDLDPVNRTDAA